MTWALRSLCRPSAKSALNHQLPGRDGGTACGSRALSEGRPAGCPFPAQYGQASRRHQRLVYCAELRRCTGGLGGIGPQQAAPGIYRGIVPPFQSGTFDSKSRRISKRGSPHLRKTLFMVASTILQHSDPDNPIFQFMDKKRAEGKHFYVYMVAGAAKFLRVYYARVKAHLTALDSGANTAA